MLELSDRLLTSSPGILMVVKLVMQIRGQKFRFASRMHKNPEHSANAGQSKEKTVRNRHA